MTEQEIKKWSAYVEERLGHRDLYDPAYKYVRELIREKTIEDYLKLCQGKQGGQNNGEYTSEY